MLWIPGLGNGAAGAAGAVGAAGAAGAAGAPKTDAQSVWAFEPPPSRLSALPARCHHDW